MDCCDSGNNEVIVQYNVLDTIYSDTENVIYYSYWNPDGDNLFTLDENNIPISFTIVPNATNYARFYIIVTTDEAENNKFSYNYYKSILDEGPVVDIEYFTDDFSSFQTVSITVVSVVTTDFQFQNIPGPIVSPYTRYNFFSFQSEIAISYTLYKSMLLQVGNYDKLLPFNYITRYITIVVPQNSFYGSIVYINNLELFTFKFRTKATVADNTFNLITLTNKTFYFDVEENVVPSVFDFPPGDQNMIFFSVIFY